METEREREGEREKKVEGEEREREGEGGDQYSTIWFPIHITFGAASTCEYIYVYSCSWNITNLIG